MFVQTVWFFIHIFVPFLELVRIRFSESARIFVVSTCLGSVAPLEVRMPKYRSVRFGFGFLAQDSILRHVWFVA